ncbi:BMP family lipoprotein [Anaerobacillus isosaccharinicus]|uniref:BMP family ABC transporter substrate-binding protein n=1 Tax=Anaerobacillus isosaccharinicus TaxID=1532552 RepID=A0A1S2LWR5_9BACI|nr:BMP family ABC transporter substrate-binding protein [Anaerobacillus isosaccharinicus]MBA5584463.1 BMP family ABC transporter substrate-binding protein [Anaerobacillus isosaccharinicus]QOY37150.1 BMP family ABC transporter substrate-binding protein [Anaerobacillus isosaccharinicus]
MVSKNTKLVVIFFLLFVMIGCSNGTDFQEKDYLKVGIMLSDVGLGDQSFSDSAFLGVMQARDELDILFSYKELGDTGTYLQGLTELVEEEHDLIIGLGFMVKDDLEKVASTYPNQQFLLIDDVSDLDNITSLVFKEHEGSFLAGLVAGMKTKTNKVGFIGGGDFPLIHKFAAGFKQGVKASNKDAEILIEYANDFGNDKLGEKMARSMIAEGADFIYPAAGYTGVGALNEAQNSGVYGIGVDTDQYFLAENAVVTSMLKKIDVAIFQAIKLFVENGELTEDIIELGLKEDGVGLAEIRIISLKANEQEILTDYIEKILSGSLTIESTLK